MAKSLNQLRAVLCALGEYQEAKKDFREALEMATDMQAVPIILEALVGIAAILMKEAKKEQALELVAYVLCHPSVEQEVMDKARLLLSELESQLESRTFAVIQKRGRAGSLEYFVRAHGSSQLGA